MYLDDLRNNLLEVARHRVRSGKITERALAKACGLSQPHMHNVLKSVRSLSIEAADSLLNALGITAADLITSFPFGDDIGTRAVPVLRARIGPGITPSFNVFGSFLGIPSHLTSGLVDPVLARVAPDLSLPRTIEANDLVLLDQSPSNRASPFQSSPYVLVDRGSAKIRYVRQGVDRVFVVSSPNPEEADTWPSVSLRGRDILDLIRARIVWISREVNQKPDEMREPKAVL